MNVLRRLENKFAIVTGAAGGIGAAIVRTFAQEGARVALLDLPAKRAQATIIAGEIGEAAHFFPCDVVKAKSCKTAVSEAIAWFGPPDILVNNAGISITGGLEDISEADWDMTFAVNVKSVLLVGREVLPQLRAAGGGSIINIASESAFMGLPMHPAYCASKAAVVHLTRCLAVRHAPDGIRINALCPGTIDTPLYRNFLAQQSDPESIHDEVVKLHPLGLGTSEDIARAAVYLASDDAGYVTGAPMMVDGGATAV